MKQKVSSGMRISSSDTSIINALGKSFLSKSLPYVLDWKTSSFNCSLEWPQSPVELEGIQLGRTALG